jgi:hypothetical protein
VTAPVRLPTFSSLPRWFACELTDVLPRAEEPSEASEAGDSRHAFFQRISELLGADENRTLDEARELALAECLPEHLEVLRAIPVDSPAFRFDSVAAEVALAVNLKTGEGRELGRGLGRDYSGAGPDELVGTIDRLGLIGEDGLYVGDYKGRAHRRAPSQDPQFLAATLAAARAYGRTWAEIEVINIVGDEVFARKERVDLLEIDTFEQRLLTRRALAEKNQVAHAADPADLPEATLGEHCRYCPSLRYCPAKMELARAVLGGDNDEIRAIKAAGAAYLTSESAARLHGLVKQAEQVLEIVKEAIVDYARQTPFQLDDGSGRWYGVPPAAQTRELLDGRKVQKVLAELFGEEAGAAGVTVKPTLEGIEKAVKAWLTANPTLSKKGAIKENREKAEALLLERGLMRVIQGGTVKVHKREG